MNDLLAAALFFVGTHLGIPSTSIRPNLVARLGERRYRALYSLLAVVALVWLVVAFRQAPWVPVWGAMAGLRHLQFLVMLLSVLLVVGSLTQRNPTAIGATTDPDAPDPATGVLRVTRHPFMWGAGLWGIGHALANGDQAAIVFFGALAVVALLGARLIDVRRTRENPPGWGVFMQATSNLPFAAILQRRQRLRPGEFGLGRLALALGLYVGLIWAHPWLFGVNVLP